MTPLEDEVMELVIRTKDYYDAVDHAHEVAEKLGCSINDVIQELYNYQ